MYVYIYIYMQLRQKTSFSHCHNVFMYFSGQHRTRALGSLRQVALYTIIRRHGRSHQPHHLRISRISVFLKNYFQFIRFIHYNNINNIILI